MTLPTVRQAPTPIAPAVRPAPASLAASIAGACRLSLHDLLDRVQGAVSQAFPRAVWVHAEIAEFRVHPKSRHAYLSLVEMEDGKEKAKVSATLWATKAATVLPRFQAATGAPMGAGQKILALAKPTFHPVYGMSLLIEDVDPAFTLGDLEQKLNGIRATLEAEGLTTRNKALPAPFCYTRIAILAPDGAAGLGDFASMAQSLENAGLLQTRTVTALFEGDRAVASLLQALDQIYALHREEPFDALCIIRGGGAKLSLAWLNDLELARRVAAAPMPVLTGIGHERDSTILDEISHTRFDTPSKVVAGIKERILANANQLREWQIMLQREVERRLAAERLQLENHRLKLVTGSRQITDTARSGLYRLTAALTAKPFELVTGHRTRLEATARPLTAPDQENRVFQIIGAERSGLEAAGRPLTAPGMENRVMQVLSAARTGLDGDGTVLRALDPQRLLERGLVMVHDREGKLVRTREQAIALGHASMVSLSFADGPLTAFVHTKRFQGATSQRAEGGAAALEAQPEAVS